MSRIRPDGQRALMGAFWFSARIAVIDTILGLAGIRPEARSGLLGPLVKPDFLMLTVVAGPTLIDWQVDLHQG